LEVFPVIVDGFTFFNELDILSIRLEELYPVVDKFVVVESDITFRGKPKPYYFEQNQKMYYKYMDKIEYVKLQDSNTYNSDEHLAPWEREKWQRNQIGQGFAGLDEDAMVIVSDVDEIPRRSTLQGLEVQEITSINMDMYYYSLNVYGGKWGAAKILPKRLFTTAQEMRAFEAKKWIDDAGWHFSYLGDPASIAMKIQSFSHWELDTPTVTDLEAIKRRMQSVQDIWGHGENYTLVDVDDSYPEAVKNSPEYFKKYIN
jgi:beta-1,4-mannosyl-glycoprotein beta-1,4-N-acetylglucosaminyltransferase